MLLTIIQLGAVIIFSGILGLILARNERQRKEIDYLKKQRVEIEFAARQKALRLLEDARGNAMQIILDATAKAGKDQNEISIELSRVAAEQQELYKQLIQNISKTVEGEAVRELNQFNQILEKETTEVQANVSKRLEEEYQKVTEEIAAYKIQKLKEVNIKLRDMVIDISRMVIGRSLNVDEQADLVIRSMEDLKKKHGL